MLQLAVKAGGWEVARHGRVDVGQCSMAQDLTPGAASGTWTPELSTIFVCREIFLALSRRKCHVSHLQRGAPAFPVWLMIKGKQQKGTEEEGKQLLAFEECE